MKNTEKEEKNFNMQKVFNLLVEKWKSEQCVFNLCTKKKLLGYQNTLVNGLKKYFLVKNGKVNKNMGELGRRNYTGMESLPF